MGHSGSGKTTLLNTLAKRQPSKINGRILVNGVEQFLATHREIAAFVEQEDTFVGSLTMEETLMYAARLALPPSLSTQELRDRTHETLEAFGLAKQHKTLIGTPLRKGLSGGQKRRVSVATQLIAGPKILYLDEPTSGLDSRASLEVVSLLRRFVRQQNIIIFASIHQPSTKTFELFDKVGLLSQGRTCCFGRVPRIISFFASVGLPVPVMSNPAEHMLEVTNVDFATTSVGDQSRLEWIVRAWSMSAKARDLERVVKHGTTKVVRHGLLAASTSSKPSTAAQVLTLLRQSFVESYRDLTA